MLNDTRPTSLSQPVPGTDVHFRLNRFVLLGYTALKSKERRQNYVIALRKLESSQEKYLLLTEKLKFWDYFDIGQVPYCLGIVIAR